MGSRQGPRTGDSFQARKVEGSKVFKLYLEHMKETVAELIAQLPPDVVSAAQVTQDEIARACYLFGAADTYNGIAEDVEAGFHAYYAKGHGLIGVASAAHDDMAETLKRLRESAADPRPE